MNYMVVAYDKKRGIGAGNDLLWQRDLPADLAHFKQLTMCASVVMGRKTFESIGRALPDRENIVVSRSQVAGGDGIICVHSIEQAFERASKSSIAIIGGASIYEQAMPYVDVVYATEVDATFDQAEVFFAPLSDDFIELSREHHAADDRNAYAFDFVEYRRTK